MASVKQAQQHSGYLQQLLKSKHVGERRLLIQSSTVSQLIFLFSVIKNIILQKIPFHDSIKDRRKIDQYRTELTEFIKKSTVIRKSKK